MTQRAYRISHAVLYSKHHGTVCRCPMRTACTGTCFGEHLTASCKVESAQTLTAQPPRPLAHSDVLKRGPQHYELSLSCDWLSLDLTLSQQQRMMSTWAEVWHYTGKLR